MLKDNTSYYLIDGRRVQFKDVSKKLQECGIDLRYNRFLILQGEVEQISLMKPKSDNGIDVGMLEYLEDIVGTSRFKEPIEKLNQKYGFFNEERCKQMNRVRISQKELKSIRDAKCEAVRAFELENRQKIEKSKLYQYHIMTLSSKLEKYEKEYNEVKKEMDELLNDEKQIEEKTKEFSNMKKSKSAEFEKMQKLQEELKDKYNEHSKEDYYLHMKQNSAKEKLKILKTQIDDNRKRLAKLKSSTKSNKNVDIIQKDNEKMEEQLKAIEEQMKEETENAQKECVDLIKKRDDLDHQLMKFKDEQSDKLNTMNEAHNKFIVLKQKSENAQDKYDQLNSKKKKVSEESLEKRKLIERYTNEIPVQKEKLDKVKKDIGCLEQKRIQLTESINSKNEELIQLKRSFSKAQSNDMVRNALMAEMRKGTLKGIYGRLGELGAIDKKYDVAISTACGRLKNFVVDTIDHAQQCVEFLKRNNLPTVTFIALDKLRVRFNDMQQFPENVPRLYDLIQVNNRDILPAFYFSLGDTLVADNLDQASRIAYGSHKFRVVTLKGDMIEIDGSMSGGGKPRSGGMGTSIKETGTTGVDDQSVIDELEDELRTIRSEREQLDTTIDSLRTELHSLEKDIQVMGENLNKCQLDVDENEKRLKQYKDNLKAQKEELEKFQNNTEINDAELQYNNARKVYDKEMAKMESKQEELKKFDDDIRDILDAKLEPIKKKKKTLQKKLKESQTKLNQIVSEMKSHELNLKKTDDALVENAQCLKDTELEIENVTIQITELMEKAKQICADLDEAKEKCETIEEELKEIQVKVHKFDDQIKKNKIRKLDLEHDMEKKFKSFSERRQKVDQYEELLNGIELEYLGDLYSDDEEEDNRAEPATPMEGDVSNQKTVPSVIRYTQQELADMNPEKLEKNIDSIGGELKKLNPNFSAIEEYRKKKSDHKAKVETLENITSKRDLYMEHLRDIKEKRLKDFKSGFITIARKLKELYRTITLGGDADLEFIDSLDPFSEGINFAVRPCKKSWKNNINLSGGEKTLASLALIFALHYYKPSPLYIMDEIDAALDFKNVSIIANYIKQRTRNTQFLIISLRNNMYELADRLIGIYKTHNITKTIPFDPVEFDRRFKHKTDFI